MNVDEKKLNWLVNAVVAAALGYFGMALPSSGQVGAVINDHAELIDQNTVCCEDRTAATLPGGPAQVLPPQPPADVVEDEGEAPEDEEEAAPEDKKAEPRKAMRWPE